MPKTAKPKREIEIENLGPVAELTIPLPDGGGVVVLKGENGAGKSTVVDGVTKLMGGKAPGLSASDGAKRGCVRLGEAVLTVTASRQAVKGELEVVGLESRLDLSALVDPGVASAESADAKRLRALVSLANVEAAPAHFHELVGGADVFAVLEVEPTDDVILLADRVKRACEKVARQHEQAATSHQMAADAHRRRTLDVDVTRESDERTLADAYAAARSKAEAMQQHNVAAAATAEAARKAQEQIAAIGLDSEDPVALAERIAGANDEISGARERIAAAEDRIAKERDFILERERARGELFRRRAAAERTAARLEELREQANARIAAPFQQETIEEAQQAARDALAAIGAGQTIREAKAAAIAWEAAKAAAKAAMKSANAYRRMAAGTDGVLSSLLPAGCPLRLEAGRLVVATSRSKSEPFADLSEGERWDLAIDFAAAQLPAGGLLTIPQAAWESLAPSLQGFVAERAKDRGIVILTAHVADGPLAVETLA